MKMYIVWDNHITYLLQTRVFGAEVQVPRSTHQTVKVNKHSCRKKMLCIPLSPEQQDL